MTMFRVMAVLAAALAAGGCSYLRFGTDRLADEVSERMNAVCSMERHKQIALSIYINGEAARHGRRYIVCCANDSRPVCNLSEGSYHTPIDDLAPRGTWSGSWPPVTTDTD